MTTGQDGHKEGPETEQTYIEIRVGEGTTVKTVFWAVVTNPSGSDAFWPLTEVLRYDDPVR